MDDIEAHAVMPPGPGLRGPGVGFGVGPEPVGFLVGILVGRFVGLSVGR